MGAFEALTDYYEKPLYQIAYELGYHISNIYILKGDENALKNECPDVYENLLTCDHNRDTRTIMRYAQDIVASWIIEDDLIFLLGKIGLNIRHSGADRDRKILSSGKISSGSDTRIHINNKKIYMEIMCDYKGYWSKYERADLRDYKYLKLKRENALFIGFDINNKKYILIDFSKPVDAKYIQSHAAYGGKPAYSIDLQNQQKLLPINYREIADKIVMLSNMR